MVTKEQVLEALNFRAFFESELGELQPDSKGEAKHILCPFHSEDTPSFSVNVEKGVFHCFGCSAKGDVFDFLKLRRGIEFKEALEELARFARLDSGSGSRAGKKEGKLASLTLADFAAAKKLPLDFLKKWGIFEYSYKGLTRVQFPYRNAKGKVTAIRSRFTPVGNEKPFRWRSGDKSSIYGLWRLSEFQAGWLLLVEGESDTLTCWKHGVPALGIPGKTLTKTVEDQASSLRNLNIFLWQEPDADELPGNVAKSLPKVKVIRAPKDFKDLSEAHLAGQDVAALVEELKERSATGASSKGL